ncbi:uncharacterized protein A1O9_06591 [Exophiala aquamarina CBS 119918]|uniref:NAD(P)-binding domain-containing protein n=1 Tax=Exophiala aquamarina CBS 119918 TaxID=1182545 RepID=A0A072PT23_9EURO|nr:uncharacterized protein A1O9_06591 [Exophiala aquamarina CBS 119918]KEF58665.1 hypothetical protein A1O9_06591 [Exophiala aquamarina CBS 119918]
MHFLVFGATGKSSKPAVTGACGSIFIETAHKEGHSIDLLARPSSVIPQKLRLCCRKIIQGRLDDPEILREAAESGADIFVSFAGPHHGQKGTPITDFYRQFLPLLGTQHSKRVLILSTPSFTAPEDRPSWKWNIGSIFMKIFSGEQYEEMVQAGVFITSLSLQDVKWVLYRVGRLTDGAAQPVVTTFLGSGRDNMSISRSSVARWVLTESQQANWTGKAPYICN